MQMEVNFMKRLKRDLDNNILGGVCAGIGKYFNVDPVLVRLLFLLGMWVFGAGVGIYIVSWLIIPPEKRV